MALCIICENEFSLPLSQKKRDKLYHSQEIDINEKNYMCEGCFHERATAEYRYVDGVVLCANLGCARNAQVMSKYCDICVNEQNE